MSAKRKKNRPTWFKVFDNVTEIIKIAPDDIAGKAFKAAMVYFEDRETLPELEPMAQMIFYTLKPMIDEAYEAYYRDVESGIKGAEKRWNTGESENRQQEKPSGIDDDLQKKEARRQELQRQYEEMILGR